MVVLRGCLPDGDDLRSWSSPRSAWTSWWRTGRVLDGEKDLVAGKRGATRLGFALLTPADQRGLTPLFWTHVRPYGEVHLDLATRLAIGNPGSGPAVIS